MSNSTLKSCRIWQLNDQADEAKRFISYEESYQRFGGPQKEDYIAVFDGPVDTNNLEKLFAKFNMDQPQGYTGHSLSMSDVVEFYDDQGSSFHYVDRFGYAEVSFGEDGPELTMPAL